MYRIKRFLTNFFAKKYNSVEEFEKTEVKEDIIAKEVSEINFFEQMRVFSKKEKIKKEILDVIDKQPELIENLSAEKLKQLISLYDKDIEEKERKIERLKRELDK